MEVGVKGAEPTARRGGFQKSKIKPNRILMSRYMEREELYR